MPTAGRLYPQLIYQGEASSPGSPGEQGGCISKITSLSLMRRTFLKAQPEPFTYGWPPRCQSPCQDLEVRMPVGTVLHFGCSGPEAGRKSPSKRFPSHRPSLSYPRAELRWEVEGILDNVSAQNLISTFNTGTNSSQCSRVCQTLH